MKSIKLLLVDDHHMFLESMCLLLNTIENFELVATATNGAEVLQLLQSYPVDVVLCDLQMPLMGGLELVPILREKYPFLKVLMLTMSDDVSNIRAAMNAGASGYLLKTANKSELEEAIWGIYAGESYFNHSLIDILSKADEAKLNEHKNNVLSERELDVLKLIIAENSSTEIAKKLFISFNTVETHRKNIYKKLGINTALGLLKYAIKNGLID